jgi:hypothetical protein
MNCTPSFLTPSTTPITNHRLLYAPSMVRQGSLRTSNGWLSIRSSARPANRTDRLGPDTACCLQPTRARWPGDPASARANLGPAPDSPKHRAAHGTRSGQTRAAHGTRSRANLDRVRPDKPGSPRAPGPLSNGRKVLGEGPSFRTRRSSTSTTPRRSCKPLDGTNSGPSSSSSSS